MVDGESRRGGCCENVHKEDNNKIRTNEKWSIFTTCGQDKR